VVKSNTQQPQANSPSISATFQQVFGSSIPQGAWALYQWAWVWRLGCGPSANAKTCDSTWFDVDMICMSRILATNVYTRGITRAFGVLPSATCNRYLLQSFLTQACSLVGWFQARSCRWDGVWWLWMVWILWDCSWRIEVLRIRLSDFPTPIHIYLSIYVYLILSIDPIWSKIIPSIYSNICSIYTYTHLNTHTDIYFYNIYIYNYI